MAETQNFLVHIDLAWIEMFFAMGGSIPVKKRLLWASNTKLRKCFLFGQNNSKS